MVAVEDINKEGSKVGEDILSKRETEDLNRGRAFVRSLLEEGGSYLSTSVEEGTTAVVNVSCHGDVSLDRITSLLIQIMKEGKSISEYSAYSRPLRVPPGTPLGDSVRLLTQVFTMYDQDRKGHLTLQEVSV